MPEKFNVIVVGAGIAGLSAALSASENKRVSIAVLDSSGGRNSNTYFAQGGIACAIGKHDSWEKHFRDTLKAGCGLCDEEVAGLVTKRGPGAVRKLMDLGLEFDGGNEEPEFGLEGGHSEKRVLHIKGDQTGKGIHSFMRKLAEERGNIQFMDSSMVEKAASHNGEYAGSISVNGMDERLACGSLVFASGGYAACFEKTTNPQSTLGTGIAVAHSAGCEVSGMEFVQFHPTTLLESVGGNYLVSEAVRGEGGKIVDTHGRQIINALDTRDRVSVAIYKETVKGNAVFLDAHNIKTDFRERFPGVYVELTRHGIDPGKELIPIETAAHYTIGGIRTSVKAATTVRSIFAAGECTNSGLHGANRLASNSLLEGLVLGKVAGENAARHAVALHKATDAAKEPREGIPANTALDAMKKVMWRCCGVMRDEAGLRDGLAGIQSLEKKAEFLGTAESVVLFNALIVSKETFKAALARKQSIGTHYRTN